VAAEKLKDFKSQRKLYEPRIYFLGSFFIVAAALVALPKNANERMIML